MLSVYILSSPVLKLMVGRLSEGPSLYTKWALLYPIILGYCTTRVPAQETQNLCNYGGQLIPEVFYEHLIGWNCFEHVGYGADVPLYVCATAEGYKVPCIKNGSIFTDFGSEESRFKILSTLEDPTAIRKLALCFFQKSVCVSGEISEIQDLNSVARVWMPSSVCNTETRNKFHIALLSVSFIIGVPASIFIAYFSWKSKSPLLSLHRNLISALTIRSLMTLLTQTQIILPIAQTSSVNNNGIPALAAFETFFLDLVLGFWLISTLYIWKFMKNDYKITPNVGIYTYIVIGLSCFFTITWIIVMASTQDLEGWLGVRYWSQWINDPIRIIFLALQIILITDTILYAFIRNPIFRKKNIFRNVGQRERVVVLYIFILTPLFALQFGLNAGTPTTNDCEEAFFYTLYFMDGVQCAVVCIFFFYLDSEVKELFAELLGLRQREALPEKTITTLDSLREKRYSDEGNGIVYSSVVHPDRYEKTLQLYQKHNLAHKTSITEIDGESFLNCSADAARKMSVVSEYYDTQSYSEFYDTIEAGEIPRKKSEFYDTIEAGEIRQKIDVQKSVPSSNEDTLKIVRENIVPVGTEQNVSPVLSPVNRSLPKSRAQNTRQITPILSSKYSTVNKSRSSSSSSSSDDSKIHKNEEENREGVVLNLAGLDGTESNDYQIRKISRSSSSTSDESVKNYPLAKPVQNFELKPNNEDLLRDQRRSIEALKGSSSEESLNLENHHLPITPYFPEVRKKISEKNYGNVSTKKDAPSLKEEKKYGWKSQFSGSSSSEDEKRQKTQENGTLKISGDISARKDTPNLRKDKKYGWKSNSSDNSSSEDERSQKVSSRRKSLSSSDSTGTSRDNRREEKPPKNARKSSKSSSSSSSDEIIRQKNLVSQHPSAENSSGAESGGVNPSKNKKRTSTSSSDSKRPSKNRREDKPRKNAKETSKSSSSSASDDGIRQENLPPTHTSGEKSSEAESDVVNPLKNKRRTSASSSDTTGISKDDRTKDKPPKNARKTSKSSSSSSSDDGIRQENLPPTHTSGEKSSEAESDVVNPLKNKTRTSSSSSDTSSLNNFRDDSGNEKKFSFDSFPAEARKRTESGERKPSTSSSDEEVINPSKDPDKKKKEANTANSSESDDQNLPQEVQNENLKIEEPNVGKVLLSVIDPKPCPLNEDLEEEDKIPNITVIEDMEVVKLVRAVPVKILTSSESSDTSESDTEKEPPFISRQSKIVTVKDLEPVFNEKYPPVFTEVQELEKPQIFAEPEDILNEEPERQHLRETLPDIYEDLKKPVPRPKSLAAGTRSDFSKMFSNHRNKLLSSKSEASLSSNKKDDQNNRKISKTVEALISPISSLERSLDGRLPSFKGVENLDILDKVEDNPGFKGYSSSSSVSLDEDTFSDSSNVSSASQVTVEKVPLPAARLVQQEKNMEKEWEPQKISF